jgi:hypothetical protein
VRTPYPGRNFYIRASTALDLKKFPGARCAVQLHSLVERGGRKSTRDSQIFRASYHPANSFSRAGHFFYFNYRIRSCRNRRSGSCWSAPAPSHTRHEPQLSCRACGAVGTHSRAKIFFPQAQCDVRPCLHPHNRVIMVEPDGAHSRPSTRP